MDLRGSSKASGTGDDFGFAQREWPRTAVCRQGGTLAELPKASAAEPRKVT